jgi:hypothetical protein
MSKHFPPIPPASVSTKGSGGSQVLDPGEGSGPNKKQVMRDRNLAEEGRQGNIKQNTTNQGYQQDR